MSETKKNKVILGDYRGIRIPEMEETVSREELAQTLERARQSAAGRKRTDKAAENGDEVVIDYIGYLNDVAFPGGSGNDYPLVLGSETFIPGFEEQLIGCRRGDQRTVHVAFPANYDAPELAGKDTVFEVFVKEVRETVLPEIDDELARNVGGCQTLEEFKENICRQILEKRKEERRNQVVTELNEICEVEITQADISEVAGNMKQNFRLQLQYSGESLDEYLYQCGMSREEFDRSAEEEARLMIKTQSILTEIAEKEGITVTDAELSTEIDRLARESRAPIDEFLESLGKDGMALIREDLEAEKALDFLIENNEKA